MKRLYFLLVWLITLPALAQEIQWAVPPTMEYDMIGTFEQGYAPMMKEKLHGCLNTDGRAILPPQYLSLGVFGEEKLVMIMDTTWNDGRLSQKYAFLDMEGKKVMGYFYNSLAGFRNGEIFLAGDEDAIFNSKGEFIRSVSFDLMMSYYMVRDKNGNMGLINDKWEYVVPPIFEWIEGFCEGLAIMKINGKSGAINTSNKIAIPPQYAELKCTDGGWVATDQEGKKGLLDARGQEIFPFVYEELSPYRKDFVVAKKEGKHGVINPAGKVLLPFQYQKIFPLAGNAMLAKKGKYWSVINKQGAAISPKKYTQMSDWYNGDDVAVKTSKGLWGFIDSTGKEIVPCLYEEFFLARQKKINNLLFLKKAGKWGAIDVEGKVAISFHYDEVFHASIGEGLVAVSKSGKYGYVDATGKEVVPLVLDGGEDMNPFSSGFAAVRYKGKWGILKNPLTK